MAESKWDAVGDQRPLLVEDADEEPLFFEAKEHELVSPLEYRPPAVINPPDVYAAQPQISGAPVIFATQPQISGSPIAVPIVGLPVAQASPTTVVVNLVAPASPPPAPAPAPIVNVTQTQHTTIQTGGGPQVLPTNHACHFILCVVTSGLWWPFWLAACCGCCCQRPCGC